MELLVLLAIFGLLVLGPRRNGRPRGRAGLLLGILILLVAALALGFGWTWNWLLNDFARR